MVTIRCDKRVTDLNYCNYYCKDRDNQCERIISEATKKSEEPTTKPATKAKTTTRNCGSKLYSDLASYFRNYCFVCECKLHCDAKNFSKCLLKSKKWLTCPRGFWTEEMWQEAIDKISSK